MTQLTRVAVYEREVEASLERVWENVHDWEHLPWLHSGSFRSIALVDRGDWGWKARIGAGPGEFLLELVRDADRERYVSRTLDGPGAGTEIWTSLTPVAEHCTSIRVEFLLPGAPKDPEKLGQGFNALYTRLWDEDEAMMQRRTALLEAKTPPSADTAVELGAIEEVRARAPFTTSFAGRRFRVAEVSGELVAHSAVCPHWLGPLDEGEIEDGCVTCPWHGYRFDVASGERRDARSPMRLAQAPQVVVDAAGRVSLAAAG